MHMPIVTVGSGTISDRQFTFSYGCGCCCSIVRTTVIIVIVYSAGYTHTMIVHQHFDFPPIARVEFRCQRRNSGRIQFGPRLESWMVAIVAVRLG